MKKIFCILLVALMALFSTSCVIKIEDGVIYYLMPVENIPDNEKIMLMALFAFHFHSFDVDFDKELNAKLEANEQVKLKGDTEVLEDIKLLRFYSSINISEVTEMYQAELALTESAQQFIPEDEDIALNPEDEDFFLDDFENSDFDDFEEPQNLNESEVSINGDELALNTKSTDKTLPSKRAPAKLLLPSLLLDFSNPVIGPENPDLKNQARVYAQGAYITLSCDINSINFYSLNKKYALIYKPQENLIKIKATFNSKESSLSSEPYKIQYDLKFSSKTSSPVITAFHNFTVKLREVCVNSDNEYLKK